jgi:hypothetical protein
MVVSALIQWRTGVIERCDSEPSLLTGHIPTLRSKNTMAIIKIIKISNIRITFVAAQK